MEEQGAIFRVVDSDRAESLRDRADYPGSFTDVVDSYGWNGKGEELVLLSLGREEIEWLGLVKRTGRVATQRDRLSFTYLNHLAEPVSFEALSRAVSPKFRRHLQPFLRSPGGRLPPGTWREVVEAMARLSPETGEILPRLRARLAPPSPWVHGPAGGVVAQEKDAMNLPLRASGMSPSHIGAWTPGDAPAPFLDGLEGAHLREDQQIEHDAQVFGSWSLVQRYRAGATLFYDGERGDRLTVINVNRTPVEHSLGVDLIYYNDQYASYVGVQYKRMEHEGSGSEVGYRPLGRNYEAELKRMTGFERLHPPAVWSGVPQEYRLHGGAFFFKLCPKLVVEPLSEAMLKGMYLPLDFWSAVVADPAVRGARGGTRLTYRNVERYVNNTLFVSLVGSGWIGSRNVATASITEIIRASVEEGRSVVLAAGFPGA